MLLSTSEHYTADNFYSIADHYEHLCAPLHGCQLVGTGNESEVGVARLLSSGDKFPCVSNHVGTTECPFTGDGMGEC